MLQQHAIRPVQQYAYTTGKNATDSALIIDAMDLLYTRRFDGFCLVSSDSDFTGLAMRLREEGLNVYGFGERKTPEAFRRACHRFVFTELLVQPKEPEAAKPQAEQSPVQPPRARLNKGFLLTALEETSDDSGWANLGAFGSYLIKLQPDFDARTFGHKKLSDLVGARPDIFIVEERRSSPSAAPSLHVRAKG